MFSKNLPVLLIVFMLFACSDSTDTGGGTNDILVPSGSDASGQSFDDAKVSKETSNTGDKDTNTTTDSNTGSVAEVEDLGKPCAENNDCISGFCVDGPKGSVCTQTCLEDCPEDYACKGIQNTGSDVVFLCVPLGGTLCAPCSDDIQCNGGRCAHIEGSGACTINCEDASECPVGYDCQTLKSADQTQQFQACIPPNLTCSCNPNTLGLKRTCWQTNDVGKCTGVETCDASLGWTGCDASIPTVETCDNVDNDCNGIVDDVESVGSSCVNTNEFGSCTGVSVCAGADGVKCTGPIPAKEICDNIDNDCNGPIDDVEGVGDPCSISNQHGSCPGVYVCAGLDGIKCAAPTPEAELCDYIDNDCDNLVDETFLVNGLYGTVDHCGSCGKSCGLAATPNGTATCIPEVPTCKMTCNPGFYDNNQNPNDGCECQFSSDIDKPYGGDTNCDGVDGELDNGIFVSKAGNDNNAGTRDAPVFTIGKALVLAQSLQKRDVYVATGVYSESIILKANVAVYGGYSADFVAHEPLVYETAIMGLAPTPQKPGTITSVGATGIAGATRLDGFKIFGSNATDAGSSSYTVYLLNSGNAVSISNNRIFSGNGAAGLDGTPGTHGTDGVSGGAGKAAYDIGTKNCTSKYHLKGGNGGNGSCQGKVVSGGNGGTSICPDYDESGAQPKSGTVNQTAQSAETGKSGQNNGAKGGAGGEPGYDGGILKSSSNCKICHIPPDQKDAVGAAGQNGALGGNGSAGTMCTNNLGSVVNGLWQSSSGGNGIAGNHGGGGGGGGAAGGVETESCGTTSMKYDDVGGSGGGGGAGGCSGNGGSLGTGGGGSFGIFVAYTQQSTSLPAVAGNTVTRGIGGKGGHGGPGGVGGAGGSGGNGGASGAAGGWITFCAANGGPGGDGGDGGHGGGGSGGCGGVSYGIYLHGQGALSPAEMKNSNTVNSSGKGGSGGLAGFSLGNPGKNGANGSSKAFNF